MDRMGGILSVPEINRAGLDVAQDLSAQDQTLKHVATPNWSQDIGGEKPNLNPLWGKSKLEETIDTLKTTASQDHAGIDKLRDALRETPPFFSAERLRRFVSASYRKAIEAQLAHMETLKFSEPQKAQEANKKSAVKKTARAVVAPAVKKTAQAVVAPVVKKKTQAVVVPARDSSTNIAVSDADIKGTLAPIQLAAGTNPFLTAIKNNNPAKAYAIYKAVVARYPEAEKREASKLLVSQIRRLYTGSEPLTNEESAKFTEVIYAMCDNEDFNSAYAQEFSANSGV